MVGHQTVGNDLDTFFVTMLAKASKKEPVVFFFQEDRQPVVPSIVKMIVLLR